MAIITLLTDFGIKDHFVASMKGVILGINPEAKIIDITHDVPKFDVMRAALILRATYKWFPSGTIHVVVVDPGVGTSRKSIVIQTKNYFFIGPDNGVLSLAADDDGAIIAREILPSGETSYTFH
ncbi:MAG: SAM-dependent chlorinase/fluorinase, partial [Thermocladium sp.]